MNPPYSDNFLEMKLHKLCDLLSFDTKSEPVLPIRVLLDLARFTVLCSSLLQRHLRKILPLVALRLVVSSLV